MIWGLLAIEARRTAAWWLVPPMAVLPWLIMRDSPRFSWFWADSSVLVRDGVIFVGPFAGGVAAWMLLRERRRRTEELLATTPYSGLPRELAIWTATLLWSGLAYLVFGACVVVETVRHAAWGGPTLWPMMIGFLAIAAEAALGFGTVRILPSRFTPSLVAVGIFAGQLAVGQAPAWFAFLSPCVSLDQSAWYGVRPNVAAPQATFFVGVIGLGLGVATLTDRQKQGLARVVILLAVILSATGVLGIRRAILADGVAGPSWARATEETRPLAYTPVCSSAPLPVCVHPAFRPWLDLTSASINRLATPLVGLPGAPVRAEQMPPGSRQQLAGTLPFTINLSDPRRPTVNDDYPVVTSDVAILLVWDSTTRYGGPSGGGAAAQEAIALWLLARAEESTPHQHNGGAGPHHHIKATGPAAAAAARFAELEPGQQQMWLRIHYPALRQGRIGLEALP